MAKKVVVVGGGLAGLSAAMRLCERGVHVMLVSLTKAKRSHSVCAQGGINAAINTKQEQDSPLIHAYDTIKGGDFLANQPPIIELCMSAPSIIFMLERLGCPFNRTPDGELDFRRFGGTLYNRTAFCGASTGQQLLYTLDEQVRKFEVLGQVERFENHEFLRLILDTENRARGIVMMDLFNLKLETLSADAVVLATGGLGFLYRKSTNSTLCTGAANGRFYQQGGLLANPEFIQVHPTTIPGVDKMRLVSESVRGEGGRIWVYGDGAKSIEDPSGKIVPCGETGKPWYFLEEFYPALGNLIPRDIASREILRITEKGLGIGKKEEVYLDITHLPENVRHKLASVLDIYRKFTKEDPAKTPMRIFPAVHYTMGGAWVDYPAAADADWSKRYRHMTNIEGCFNCGESDYQYHGANRLGANALLACIFSGLVVGDDLTRYLDNALPQAESSIYREALRQEEEKQKELLQRQGIENVHALHEELADVLLYHVTVKRNNEKLKQTMEKIYEIQERFQKISLSDRSRFANQTYIFANQFGPMLDLALAITKAALLRDEFRGAHFKPEFPQRDDEHFLKTTIATYHKDGPQIRYEPVDTRHLKPFLRDYTHAKRTIPTLENIPTKLPLPI